MIAARRARRRAFHPRRLSAGLAARGDRLLVAARAGEGRRELRDRRHRIALVRSRPARHRPAHRRGAGRSDDGRRHAAEAGGVDRGVRRRGRRARARPFASAAKIWPRILVRFDNGAKGCVSVGQVCAGHKNGLWFEVNGGSASLRWQQERQNELWIGRRDTANGVLAKDPSLLAPAARAVRAPAGRPSGRRGRTRSATSCAISTAFIAAGKRRRPRVRRRSRRSKTAIMSACLVDAVLESHRQRRRLDAVGRQSVERDGP